MMLTYLGEDRKNMCCIAQCPEIAMTSLHKASSEEIQSALETVGLKCFTPEIPTPTPLCKHHYHLIYNLVQPTQTHCVTCGTSLKHSSPKVCPQPEVIEKHLRDNTDYDGHINNHDKVCYACYRAHLVILKRGDDIASSDSHLQQLIMTLSQQISSNVSSVKEAIDASMKRVVVDVGRELMDKNALLLPTVRDLLCQYATELLRVNNLESEDITQLVTSRWILSNLTATLQDHMTYKCSVRKYGTLIYRPNTDLRPTLAQALWRVQNYEKVGTAVLQDSDSSKTISEETGTRYLEELNARVHSQIRALLAKDAVSPYDHDNIAIDKLIES